MGKLHYSIYIIKYNHAIYFTKMTDDSDIIILSCMILYFIYIIYKLFYLFIYLPSCLRCLRRSIIPLHFLIEMYKSGRLLWKCETKTLATPPEQCACMHGRRICTCWWPCVAWLVWRMSCEVYAWGGACLVWGMPRVVNTWPGVCLG